MHTYLNPSHTLWCFLIAENSHLTMLPLRVRVREHTCAHLYMEGRMPSEQPITCATQPMSYVLTHCTVHRANIASYAHIRSVFTHAPYFLPSPSTHIPICAYIHHVGVSACVRLYKKSGTSPFVAAMCSTRHFPHPSTLPFLSFLPFLPHHHHHHPRRRRLYCCHLSNLCLQLLYIIRLHLLPLS